MSDSSSGSHRYFRLPASPLLSRAVAGLAVLGTVAGLSLASSSTALAADGGPGLDGGTVFLSEASTHGAGTNDNVVTDGDWIELHNASTTTAEPIGGAVLSDSENSHELVIPAGTTIPANGYVAFRTDSEAAGGAGFSLGDQDEARLYASTTAFDGGSGTPADEFDWNHSPVFSWARNFAASPGDPEDATWQASASTTPSAANNFTAAHTGALTNIVINEVNMNGGTHGDWIELYNKDPNTSDAAVNLTGAILSDNDDTHAYIIGNQTGDTTSLAPGAFAAYQVDNSSVNGNFGLGGSDAARLYTGAVLDLYGNGTDPSVETQPDVHGTGGAPTVDKVIWATAPVTSLGRFPDGNGVLGTSANDSSAFSPTGTPTFAAANVATGGFTHENLAGMVINEVKTTGDPNLGDWVELLNTNSSGSVNLSNAILSDNNNNHIIRIASGTMLAAGATLVIRTDTDGGTVNSSGTPLASQPATGSFGLGDDDEIRLYDADATTLGAVGAASPNGPVDSFSWTTHAQTSYGRKAGQTATNTESSTVWGKTTVPTPGTATNTFTGTATPDLTWVQINEVEPTDNAGNTFPGRDWIELVNTDPTLSDSAINLNGAIVSDNGGDSGTNEIVLSSSNTTVGPNLAGQTAGTMLEPGQFAVIEVDNPAITGNFGLGSNDAARLFEPGANVQTSIPIDHFEWTDFPATGSFQRQSGGLGGWAVCGTQTGGSANSSTGCTPVS